MIDTNLPPALAAWLRSDGHEATHAADELSASADDREIWDHATATDAVVVTKDSDYLMLAASRPSTRMVLIRCGNLRLIPFRIWMFDRLPAIVAALEAGETVVEAR